jgi:hypothetical protein
MIHARDHRRARRTSSRARNFFARAMMRDVLSDHSTHRAAKTFSPHIDDEMRVTMHCSILFSYAALWRRKPA